MAQLRDVQTSELIAEGTPLELALIAGRLGEREVLFDDVGEGFDPAAVRQAAEQNAAGLEGAAAEATGDDAARLAEAAAEARADLELDVAAANEAARELEAARARREP